MKIKINKAKEYLKKQTYGQERKPFKFSPVIFDKETKTIQWRKGQLPNTDSGQVNYPRPKLQLTQMLLKPSRKNKINQVLHGPWTKAMLSVNVDVLELKKNQIYDTFMMTTPKSGENLQ